MKRIGNSDYQETTSLNLKNEAKTLLSEGLSIIPVNNDKIPTLSSWKEYQYKPMREEDIDSIFNGSGLAIICGKVSGGLEVIDVDVKYDLTGTLWENLKSEIQDFLPELYDKLVIVTTKNKGYHLYYRCPEIQGNIKLAIRPTKDSERDETYKKELDNRATEDNAQQRAKNDKTKVLIETKGEGGYVVAPPTLGYKFVQGDTSSIPLITAYERDLLLNICRSFNEIHSEITKEESRVNKEWDNSRLSPFDDFNKRADVEGMLVKHGWEKGMQRGERINFLRPGKTESKTSGNYHVRLRIFYPFTTSTDFEAGKGYNAVGVYTVLECGGNYSEASKKLFVEGYGDRRPSSKKGEDDKINEKSVENTLKQKADQYIRVGDDYFKKIHRDDGGGYLKSIGKQTIIDDHGKKIIQHIPKYDDWTMQPSSKNFQQAIGKLYNLYHQFPHHQHKGNCEKILSFIRHIFSEQYEHGLDYFTILYLHPERRLPVLVLVSKERETGKTTFLNFVKILFGGNVVFISSSDLEQSFNWHYATANIICIDEAFIDKKPAFEKLKMLATAKNLPINQKYVKQSMIEFFGKIIICANDELDVIKIDQQETRYWVIKVAKPDKDNVSILEEMKAEIPAFIHYLETRPMASDKPESRLWLSINKYQTEALQAIRENSKSQMYKELKEHISNWFISNDSIHEFYADPSDLKDRFFDNNKDDLSYLRRVLKDEFNLAPTKQRYRPFDNGTEKQGRSYCFKREHFVNDDNNELEI